MGNPSDLAAEPSGAAQEAWGAQPAPATRWHCLPGPRGGWGLRMTFPLRLPDLVFPSDWCEGPRPTPQLAAGRAWLCGLKQVPLPLWASARGCLLSSQWHVPPGSGWGGLWANCGPVSLKCNSLSSRLPSGWGRLLDLHLLSPAPVHLSTCLHHKGHLRKALLVPHRRKGGRATDWLPPGFRSRQNPLPYAPTARPAPSTLLCSPLHPQDFFHLFIYAVFKKKEEELTQCCRARGSSHAPRNTPVTSDVMPKPLPTPCR